MFSSKRLSFIDLANCPEPITALGESRNFLRSAGHPLAQFRKSHKIFPFFPATCPLHLRKSLVPARYIKPREAIIHWPVKFLELVFRAPLGSRARRMPRAGIGVRKEF